MKNLKVVSIKNSFELVKKINNVILSDDKLVSFDVIALFPSIPRKKLLIFLKKWLNSLELGNDLIDDFVKLTNL